VAARDVGNDDAQAAKQSDREGTRREPSRQAAKFLFIDFHTATEPTLPQVAAARERDRQVRDRIERGVFAPEDRADFAARMARNEFLNGIKRRAPR
jgi:hypothetical protein